MLDEYSNKIAPEVNPQAENKIAKENAVVSENKFAKENISAQENLDSPKKSAAKKFQQEKKNRALSVLSAGLVGTIALVLTTMTSLVNVKMKAEFNEVNYVDGRLEYSINVKDMTEQETLTIYPKRDNKAMEPISLIDDDGDGLIEGIIDLDKEYISQQLASGENVNIKYVLDLKGVVGLNVERAFDRWVIRIDKMTSKFEDVGYYCNCDVDGYFYFTMNFEDDNNVFTGFEAYIEDNLGNRSVCKFSDNLHDEQKIYVNDLKTSAGKLVIKYLTNGEETYVQGTDANGNKVNWISINM